MRNSADLKGIHSSKTMGSAKLRSIPKGNSNSNYLDLYLLEKEKERLLKELKRIETRREQIQYRLDEIIKEMGEDSKEKVTVKEKPRTFITTGKKEKKKEWKTIDISY
jgi:hypothetical protein